MLETQCVAEETIEQQLDGMVKNIEEEEKKQEEKLKASGGDHSGDDHKCPHGAAAESDHRGC